MKRRHTPDELAAALRERFPAPYSLSFRQVAEAAVELIDPGPEPVPEPDGALTPEQAKALLKEEDNGYMGTKTIFDKSKCQHCGGLHARKCPAVAEIEYHPDGKVSRVVYFPHGSWPADEVLWLEDVVKAAEAETD
ncbi:MULTISPECIES: hypothetical protein [Arthrobacter]|uniref:4Fe-4S ferredoxin-type domain-containing protein n=1 Tax=Arthrobacter terricola TaxID=2547396 RepID=A0A4R5KML9_9MICC|nr:MULTISPECIES: hypothetical protein [Arthrobacter]MBT8161005.1 hypothetical protein [Arthrobacter sp. GN70]TDF96869.1 hypothetical protein E1809_09095 [Arthrobacter terricola]